MSRKPPQLPGGLVVVDKPAGMTSHDVVGQLRRLLKTRRIGHAGTLDPMATGVLVIGVERATKLLNFLPLEPKRYLATVRFGAGSDTDDADGVLGDYTDPAAVTTEQVRAALGPLTGDILQRPATVSALKIDGTRAYTLARAGVVVELAERPVTVSRFELVGEPRLVDGYLDVDVDVECSAGTYIRALARDLGAQLGVGAHLSALRRTQVGVFELCHAKTLVELSAAELTAAAFTAAVLTECTTPIALPLPMAIAAVMPTRLLTAGEAAELSFGRTIDPIGVEGTYGGLLPGANSAGVGGASVAVALLVESGGRARPVLGFTPAGT